LTAGHRPPGRCLAVALCLAVAPAGAGCTADGRDGGSGGASGVRGVVVVDAGCPPTAADPACPTGPLAARLQFVAADDGARAGAVDTGADGTFSLALPPGTYEVRPDNLAGTPYPRADPVTVVVEEGRFTEVTVRFDSGVR
jgi:hypothetical protein